MINFFNSNNLIVIAKWAKQFPSCGSILDTVRQLSDLLHKHTCCNIVSTKVS